MKSNKLIKSIVQSAIVIAALSSSPIRAVTFTGSVQTVWSSSVEVWITMSSDPGTWIFVPKLTAGPRGSSNVMTPILLAAKANNYNGLTITTSPSSQYPGFEELDNIQLINGVNYGSPGTVSELRISEGESGPNGFGYGPVFATIPEATPNGDYGFFVHGAMQAGSLAQALITGAQITYEEDCWSSGGLYNCFRLSTLQID